jgi:HK97 family phage major capsid protein
MRHFMNLRGSPLETKSAPDGLEELKSAFGTYHGEVKSLAAEQRKLAAAVDKIEVAFARLPRDMRPGDRKTGAPDPSAEYKATGFYVKEGDVSEFKTLEATEMTAGGYLVGTNMATTINRKIFDQSPLRRLSRIVTLTTGDVWEEPRDFDDVGAEWAGERQSRPETTNPELGLTAIPLHEIYAHQTVTQKLMDLSFVDIGAWLEGKIADKFARTEGLAYLSGDGVKKPRGVMDYAADSVTTSDASRAWGKLQHVVSGSSATVADANGQSNGLRDLYWSLRAPYRANASWLMSSATANSLDKLKDENGNYIWRNSMTAGAPPELLGRPVEFDESMPAEGAGLYPIAFGDFRQAYTIVDWSGIKYLRDPYSSKPHMIIYVYRRTGGDVTNFEGVKLLKCAAS